MTENRIRIAFLLGIGLGCLMSALSWFGNSRASFRWISVYPDLITLGALPVLVFLALWIVAQRCNGLTRANLRWIAMTIVGVGGTLFAVSHTILGIVRLSYQPMFMFVIWFATTFLSFVVVGYVTAVATTRWLEGQRR